LERYQPVFSKHPECPHCLSHKPLQTPASLHLLITTCSSPEPLAFPQRFDTLGRFLSGKREVSRNYSGFSLQKDLRKEKKSTILLVYRWPYQSLG